MLRLDELPLSPDLRRRLRAWADDHDRLLGVRLAWPGEDVRREWVARGAELAAAVRSELGPAVEVTYAEH